MANDDTTPQNEGKSDYGDLFTAEEFSRETHSLKSILEKMKILEVLERTRQHRGSWQSRVSEKENMPVVEEEAPPPRGRG